MLGKIQKDWKKLVQMKIYYFAAIAHVSRLLREAEQCNINTLLRTAAQLRCSLVLVDSQMTPMLSLPLLASTAAHGKAG